MSSGKSDLLAELEANVSPEMVLAQVPGIGPTFAQRIVDHLHIGTLPELEEAAHDGRLASVEGFGPRRLDSVRTALAGMLSLSLPKNPSAHFMERQSEVKCAPSYPLP